MPDIVGENVPIESERQIERERVRQTQLGNLSILDSLEQKLVDTANYATLFAVANLISI